MVELGIPRPVHLARVVRESIVRYCIEPATERKKRHAIEGLLALEPAPVPDDYADWEAEYGGRKAAGGRFSEDVSEADHDRHG